VPAFLKPSAVAVVTHRHQSEASEDVVKLAREAIINARVVKVGAPRFVVAVPSKEEAAAKRVLFGRE